MFLYSAGGKIKGWKPEDERIERDREFLPWKNGGR
jgi:hypothetical protein